MVGSGSLEQDGPLPAVAMKKEEQRRLTVGGIGDRTWVMLQKRGLWFLLKDNHITPMDRCSDHL